MSDADPRVAEREHRPGTVLDAAARRVAAEIEGKYPVLTPGGASRARAYLQTLTSKITQVLEGADPRPIRDWLASSPMYEGLMDALGRELIEGGVVPLSAPATIDVLRAWIALSAPPRPWVDGGQGHGHGEDLPSRMRGPDAFELLVEVAHDFRSPLTSILFLAEALRDGHAAPVTDLQRSQLGLIYSAAFGLASIASDIMDLAREEKDLIDDQAEAFPIAEVFQSVERMVRPLVEEKRLQLRTVVPDRWQSRGHPHALSRILLNLTTNALKFTDDGSVELGVRPLPHGRLEYYVQDTGRGITPEQQRTLFQPFRRRSGNPKDGFHFSGSGIGLSIARRLLRAMGSDLSLDYSDDRGTRFSFVLRASATS
ncbi:MAG: HAMP domain-containing sensor histidine kinase [Gemmatimonadota bacterium]|jgi:signal transduction histidine kinase